ncbi:MAG: ATP-dependent DNA ligase [Actinomycetota bacterium]|nr:ATP-dependent DNA ligase [Actinomycetota bacterium]
MLLQRVVEVSARVATTSSRLAKRDLIAVLLREALPDELAVATAYLSGTLPQRRTGVGWRGLSDLPAPADHPSLTLAEVDAVVGRLGEMGGPGSGAARRAAVTALFGQLTESEQQFLRNLLTGQVRQGALDSVMIDAIAAAADLPAADVRRAAMFSAPTGPIAVAALTGGADALASFDLQVGRPIRPMLASAAPDIAGAVEKIRAGADPDGFVVDTKLDGIRVQVHKHGDEISVFTRSLEEISERLPEVVALTRGLPARDLVLDGEAMTFDRSGRPRPFQETASETATHGAGGDIRPFFFDLLLHDDDSLVRVPARTRLHRLDALVPESLRAGRLVTSSVEEAQRFFEQAVADGQEGVILKRVDATYDAGRRGSAWVKVKPRHTLDLVVLAAEWGSGRRRGKLSNIHLGARDPRSGGFVMLGKTFKGMTDQVLAWQTERFLALETGREGHVVHVRPEQVVEIAFDGVQRSGRYPGGAALRFARVLRYRDDKRADEADTIAEVRRIAGH